MNKQRSFLYLLLLCLPLLMGPVTGGNSGGTSTGATNSGSTDSTQPTSPTSDSANTRTTIITPSITPKLPSTETNIDPISGNATTINSANSFSALSPCPGDPSRTNVSNAWPASANCPDINGNWPASVVSGSGGITFIPDPLNGTTNYDSRVANCPANCTATRYVDNPTHPSVVQQAVCPVGYEVSATYNMQPEYIWLTQPLTIPAPIFWSDYVKYNTQGYTCTDSGTTADALKECVNAGSADYVTYASRVKVGSTPDVNDSNGAIAQDPSGYAGLWVPTEAGDYSGYCFLAGSSCGTPAAGWPHPGQVGCTPIDIYDVQIDYKFHYYQCSMAASNYVQTTNSVPASVVCSRISTQYVAP